MKELKILAELESDMIVHYNSAWFENETKLNEKFPTIYIQMELCETKLESLLNDINSEFKQDFDTGLTPIGFYLASRFFVEIVEGLNFLHSQKQPIVHCDFRLSNILVKSTLNLRGQLLKICDFGLSTILVEVENSDKEINQSVGEHDIADHVAPEVRKGEKLGQKYDIYSLGIIAIKMFLNTELKYDEN